ncbi:MAG: SEC-C domain-containing protein [Deltaproteobacteria bacterium]|nr:SEC-C domain-containing protein [Deltaproteobacteria bacterium]
MSVESIDKKSLSSVCVTLCKGACCDPWWGIIFYTLKKERGLAGLDDFKKEISGSIKERAERIKSQYRTNEDPPRRLFKDPERYNVKVEDIRGGSTLLIRLRAMFAFRCAFLSDEKKCLIHPAIIGMDTRPGRCAMLGSVTARPGSEGYCRIIDAALRSSGDEAEIIRMVELERKASAGHYGEGSLSAIDAAGRVLEEVRQYCSRPVPFMQTARAEKTPARNDPCYCGSGRKYKKCHGG